jgi:hypothetical protein
MKNPLFRDYTFEDWQSLAFEAKREIWNHYWNPYEPQIGAATRSNIIEAFRRQFPELALHAHKIGFGYFGFDVGAIYIVVADAKLRVPTHFADLPVNKGVIERFLNQKTALVAWRDVGGNHNQVQLDENVV